MLTDRLVDRVLIEPSLFGLAARFLDFLTPCRFGAHCQAFFEKLAIDLRKLVDQLKDVLNVC